MSALLSPQRSVRKIFKVPGEGAYELNFELEPPPPPPTKPPPNSTTPPTPPPPPPFTAGPLGLPKVTKLAFARARLHPPPSPPDASPPLTPPTAPMFSLRKLPVLSTLSAKFSSTTDEEPSTSATSANATSEADSPRIPPRAARPLREIPGVLAYNVHESVILYDLADKEKTILQARSPPVAQAMQIAGDALRLLVGCANGEVVYYPDVIMGDAKRSRAAAAVASLANVAAGTNTGPQNFVYNRDGATNPTRVVDVCFVPSSTSKFMSIHVDGGIVVYDARYKPSQGSLRPAVNTTGGSQEGEAGLEKVNGERGEKGDKERERSASSGGNGEKVASRRNGMGANIGQHEILVTKQSKAKRFNPAAIWQIGRHAITACEFSPVAHGESRWVAIAGRDGYLRIVDFSKELPLVAFRSYFGAFLCVAWSPDGKYVATGGEDDLVSIWCPSEERLVARLEGHTSWVSAVAWDEALSGIRRYRVGSAGQDAKLILWDFALDMLHHRSSQRIGSGVARSRSHVRDGSSVNGVGERRGKLARLRGYNAAVENEGGVVGPVRTGVVVSALGRAEVPVLEPVIAHMAHGEPLTDVWFQECGIFTADAAGGIKMWSRPAAHGMPELLLEGRRGIGGDLD